MKIGRAHDNWSKERGGTSEPWMLSGNLVTSDIDEEKEETYKKCLQLLGGLKRSV